MSDSERPRDDDPRYQNLESYKREALSRARDRWAEEADVNDRKGWPDDGTKITCNVPVKRGRWAGQNCKNQAGLHTPHLGYGPCWAHGGVKLKGRAEGAWVAAHAFAQQLNVNPWDALLMAVRIAAGKVAYCEHVIGTAKSDLELEGRVERLSGGDGEPGLLIHPDTGEPLGVGDFRDLSFWRQQSELWHDRLAKTSKMAIDAGIAAYEVQRVEAEAQRMARVLNAVLDGLEGEISESTALKARAIMREELLLIEEEETRVSGALGRASDPDRAVVDSTGTWEE